MVFFKYLFIFCLFSSIGWILEVLYRSRQEKKFVNPGFMSGCTLPIYGFGAVIMYIICNLFSKINSNYKVILIFILSVIMLTILEYISGYLLLKLFSIRLWDYSDKKLNIKGFVCIYFSCIWGILSLVFYYLFYPHINSLAVSFIDNKICLFFLGTYVGVFLVDLACSINLLNNLTKYAKGIRETINVERLKLDVRIKQNKKKFLNAIYPYLSTNKYLKEKIKDMNKK